MSHVYQPVMIMKLLSNQGKAKADEIAFDLVQNDLSQLEYYTERVNQMVGKVLRNNQIVSKKFNQDFVFFNFDDGATRSVGNISLLRWLTRNFELLCFVE